MIDFALAGLFDANNLLQKAQTWNISGLSWKLRKEHTGTSPFASISDQHTVSVSNAHTA